MEANNRRKLLTMLVLILGALGGLVSGILFHEDRYITRREVAQVTDSLRQESRETRLRVLEAHRDALEERIFSLLQKSHQGQLSGMELERMDELKRRLRSVQEDIMFLRQSIHR